MKKAEAQRPLLKSFPAQGITKLRMFVLRVSNPLKTMCGYIGSLDILVIALEQQLCAILNWTLSVCSTIRHIYRAYKLTSQIVHGVLWEKNSRNVMSPTSLWHWEPAKTCKALSSQKSCAILASICSTDSVFKSQVLQILLSRCTTTERQSSDLCVCVCARAESGHMTKPKMMSLSDGLVYYIRNKLSHAVSWALNCNLEFPMYISAKSQLTQQVSRSITQIT